MILQLIPLSKDDTWAWLVHQRKPIPSTYPMIRDPCPFPRSISIEGIKKSITEFIGATSLIELRHYGILGFLHLFPEEISKFLEKCEYGDLFFKVPMQWLDFPFELCYIPRRDFLCSIYKMGTCLCDSFNTQNSASNSTNDIYRETIPSRKFLIIADPAGDLNSAHNEGVSIKKKVDTTSYLPHLISSSHKKKIMEEIAQSSIVHFAGHGDGSGWKLKDDEYITLEDMQHAGIYHHVPFLVFSNSCTSKTTSDITSISRIIKAFVRAGVQQIISPVKPIVNSNSASECAEKFYSFFLREYSPSKALFEAKKRMAEKENEDMNLAFLFYRLFGDPIATDSAHTGSPPKMRRFFNKKVGSLVAMIVIGIVGFGIVILTPVANDIQRVLSRHNAIIGNKEGKIFTDTIYWIATDYKVSKDSTKLENEIKDKLIGEKALSKYNFKVRIIPYGNILQELLTGKRCIASISPFCFIYNKFLFPDTLGTFVCIGQKVLNRKVDNYLSGFIVHRKSNIRSTSDITADHVRTIFFNQEHLSTSTYVLPMIFCVEHGLMTKIEQKQLMTQPDMIRLIQEQQSSYDKIGTISNEGWIRLQIQGLDDNLNFIPINDIPIPYDPLYLNPELWDSLQASLIIEALGNSICKLSKPWEEEYSEFTHYVTSGVITQKNGNTYSVDLAPAGFDLNHMNDTLNVRKKCKACVYQFSPMNILHNDQKRLTLVMTKIAEGTLSKEISSLPSSDMALLTIQGSAEKSLIGMHVLLNCE
ncbi:MAG: CHAT domain-containing protein [Chitinivibrionales bacterium]|nr:CHAT domain-containing protein [Chitinivibrionales bacterium]